MSTADGGSALLLVLQWLLGTPNRGSVLYTASKALRSFSNAALDNLVIASISELVPLSRRHALGEVEWLNSPSFEIFPAPLPFFCLLLDK